MFVRKDPSGRHWVEVEVEVPGSPEEVWQAIASGPGISAWFVPTQVEEREGGAIAANYGPGMDSMSTITAWEPPRRFAADSQDMGPDAPTIATEWTVEGRAGGACVVRVVHSWFASSDDWDNQFEGTAHGWVAFFRILRLYLAHFRGQPCAAFQLMGAAPEPAAEAWAALSDALGMASPAVGAHMRAAAGPAPLAGVVEHVGPAECPELLLRLDEPTGGAAHLFALPMGGQVFLPVRVYLYGERAAAAVARDEPAWQAWMSERFPMANEASQSA